MPVVHLFRRRSPTQLGKRFLGVSGFALLVTSLAAVKEILSNLVGGNLRAFPRTSGFGGISEYQPLRDRSLLGHHTKVVFPPFPSHDKFSQKRRHRGHVRQLPEVRRPQTFAPASAARSVCVRSVAARFFQPPRLA